MISPASKKLLEECGIDEEEFQEALNMVKELRIKKKEEQGLAKATVTEATARVAEVEAGMDPIIDNFLVEATTETRSPTTCSPRVCLGLSFTSSTAAPLPVRLGRNPFNLVFFRKTCHFLSNRFLVMNPCSLQISLRQGPRGVANIRERTVAWVLQPALFNKTHSEAHDGTQLSDKPSTRFRCTHAGYELGLPSARPLPTCLSGT
ncbi:hypothetical protein PM082_015049 [Marasmius tenuissimus]|nr:hypothetical protein PM082_015049 [Marasmius tenuissimus]